MLSFMDAFSGYNQIKMDPKDIAKTVFIRHRAVYAYLVMPFGLVNAGATYQRAMNKIFTNQLGRNMESYVDDMITKSKMMEDHTNDLQECFETLHKYDMKLNPDKCAFAMASGKFLGFLISNKGIEVNPEKLQAIQEMQPPRTRKDMQKLTGSLASLRRFISDWAGRCLPFFDLLKGPGNSKSLQWTPECQIAFEGFK